MSLTSVQRRLALVAAALLLATFAVAAGPVSKGEAAPQAANAPQVALWLTIAHINDGESQLIDAGTGVEDYGGVARLATVVKNIKAEALDRPNGGFLALNAGDNFLAGPEFNESLQKGVPFFDSIALNKIGFDALAIGNHEFDFGPNVFAQFIKGFDKDATFVSANLNVSGEPKLQKLAEQGRIVK
ncbi:MAG TPA: bifunctional metallophosphatase/5'-nucleotidase, partial [Actinomycetota bacterium]|nr:bifunctional metallophosphatase/5'-nucleotidase [Actinomycetota bacterium]